MAVDIWCAKCGSDTEGAHYGSCPDHPNNQAIAKRYGQPRPSVQEAVRRANTQTSATGKAGWFSASTEMRFSKDQLKRIFEYFLLNVLDLDVEVSTLRLSSTYGADIAFKSRPPIVEVASTEMTEAELIALQEVKDEMVREREAG